MGNSEPRYLRGESDVFIGKRKRFKRYLVCSLQGYFPVMVKTGEKSLAIVFRTGGTHVSITGTLAVTTSVDGGKSWTDPVEIEPRYDDVRNPAFGINNEGELITAYWKSKESAYQEKEDGSGFHWVGMKDDEEQTEIYICKSKDDGNTWAKAERYISEIVDSGCPYGRIIAAPDGTLLMPVYGLRKKESSSESEAEKVSILVRSTDGGKTWGDESLVAAGYNETSFCYTEDGKLIAAPRSWDGAHVAICVSEDDGYTWSEPIKVTRDGEHPADLTLLDSGNILMTFGRRIRPYGVGGIISEDNGRTWNFDREIMLAGDGVRDHDLGYPSTVQLDNGKIITALYYASGSDMSDAFGGWGDISCQVIHYREEDIKI